jgi:hypothetical protein
MRSPDDTGGLRPGALLVTGGIALAGSLISDA